MFHLFNIGGDALQIGDGSGGEMIALFLLEQGGVALQALQRRLEIVGEGADEQIGIGLGLRLAGGAPVADEGDDALLRLPRGEPGGESLHLVEAAIGGGHLDFFRAGGPGCALSDGHWSAAKSGKRALKDLPAVIAGPLQKSAVHLFEAVLSGIDDDGRIGKGVENGEVFLAKTVEDLMAPLGALLPMGPFHRGDHKVGAELSQGDLRARERALRHACEIESAGYLLRGDDGDKEFLTDIEDEGVDVILAGDGLPAD